MLCPTLNTERAHEKENTPENALKFENMAR